jgi:hypothetical protein
MVRDRGSKGMDGCPLTPPLSQPALAEKPAAMTQPPAHPFTEVKETSYQPPNECHFATTPTKPAKDKEPVSEELPFVRATLLTQGENST